MRAQLPRMIVLLLLAALGPACGDPGPIPPPVSRFPPVFINPDLRMNTDPVASGSVFNPVVTTDGPNVYVAWLDTRNGTGDIYFRRSGNYGATWSSSDVRINHNPPGTSWAAQCEVWVQNGTVYVIWADGRFGYGAICLNYSTDGGVTWQASDIRVDHNPGPSGSAEYPLICGSGNSLYVAWYDTRNGALPDVYFNRSLDGGATWLAADVRLNTNAAASAEARYQSLCCSGSRVYCAWEDDRNTQRDIFFNYSADGGTTWQSTDRRLDTDAPGAGDSGEVRLAASGNSVYAVWSDSRDGASDIRFNRSTDGGVNWKATDTRIDSDGAGANASFMPDLACTGSQVYIVWSDRRNVSAASNHEDIYLACSHDGGATWPAGNVRLNTDAAGAASAEAPRIRCSGAYVFVAWMDERNGAWPDIYLNASADSGNTWLATDLRVNTSPAAGAQAVYPNLWCQGPSVYVVWTDDRNSNFGDIYFSRSTP